MDRVLETLVLQDYEVVFEVNPATDRFRKIISKPDALVLFPDEGQMSQAKDFIVTDRIFEADRSIFLSETQLDHVLAKMKGDEPLSIKYRRYSDKNELHYRSISFIPGKNSATFICAIRDETNEVHRQYEKNLDLRLKNEGIRFIVENMCENFMIVNVTTHECTTFTNSEGNIACKNRYESQINWFADNIVMPENRQRYLEYFELDSLMERIVEEGGVSSITFPVTYKGGRRDFAVTSTLIDDPSERQKNHAIFPVLHRTITSIRGSRRKKPRIARFQPVRSVDASIEPCHD